jgi:hypothetical protein
MSPSQESEEGFSYLLVRVGIGTEKEETMDVDAIKNVMFLSNTSKRLSTTTR